MATAPTFERLYDSRSIAGDLRKVYVGTDPLAMLCFWQKLLRMWDTSPVQVKYQFMLAFTPSSHQPPIYSQESAKTWIN